MRRKKERKKDTASKKEPALLLHNLIVCIYTLHQRKKRKKERKKERKVNDMHIYIALKKERRKRKKEEKERKKTACALSEDSDQPGHPVWSEFSLSAWRKLGSLPTHWAHIEDYDLPGRMPRLIWVFAGRKDHFVGLVMRRLIYFKRAFAFKLKCSCWKEKVSMRGYILWNIP